MKTTSILIVFTNVIPSNTSCLYNNVHQIELICLLKLGTVVVLDSKVK